MKQKKIVFTLIGIVVALLIGTLIGYSAGFNQQRAQNISSYDECVAAGYPVQESYPARCTIPGGKGFSQNAATILEGKVVCLPHKDSDGPQTLECAAGLQTDEGKYYMLHSNKPDSSLAEIAGSDKRVRITGTLRPNDTDTYQSSGIVDIERYELIR